MAIPWIPEGKKRYTLTLTIAHVDRFQTLVKRLGLPPNTMSNAVDDLIGSLSDTFQTALDKGSLQLSDLFRVMGKQMELIEEGGKPNVYEKRNTKSNTKKP
jgi:hypothetical protein